MTSTTLTREIAAEEALGRTLGQFVGSWVALREHEVVADARTLNALLDKIEGTPVDGVLQIWSGRYFLNESSSAEPAGARVRARQSNRLAPNHQDDCAKCTPAHLLEPLYI